MTYHTYARFLNHRLKDPLHNSNRLSPASCSRRSLLTCLAAPQSRARLPTSSSAAKWSPHYYILSRSSSKLTTRIFGLGVAFGMDPKPEHKRVYLATKDMFTKERAKLKKLKSIRKAITNTGKDSELQKLVDEFGIETICQWVQELLCDGIYEFSGQASNRFPELFEPSFSLSQESALLEAEASRKEEIAVQEAVHNNSSDDQDVEDEGGNKSQEGVSNDKEGEHELVKGKTGE